MPGLDVLMGWATPVLFFVGLGLVCLFGWFLQRGSK